MDGGRLVLKMYFRGRERAWSYLLAEEDLERTVNALGNAEPRGEEPRLGYLLFSTGDRREVAVALSELQFARLIPLDAWAREPGDPVVAPDGCARVWIRDRREPIVLGPTNAAGIFTLFAGLEEREYRLAPIRELSGGDDESIFFNCPEILVLEAPLEVYRRGFLTRR
jgi:hypothetical protein